MYPNKKKAKKKTYVIKCHFEGCENEFVGSKVRKYCDEHLKKDYRKVKYVYKDERKLDIESISVENIYYKHDNFMTEKAIFNCACCGKPYEVLILPRTFIYPEHCEEHRSEYKREIFKKTLIINE